MKSLPFRQVHLDFHTSEHIPGVGSAFDPDEFADTLAAAHVNSVTLFAKCHHGWSYYPTEIGTPHPNLERPDLLGEMITACRARNIQTPVYLTVQWDEMTAREHPEWRVLSANGPFPVEGSQLSASWHPLSLANQPLVEQIIAQSVEVVEKYDPDGLFMDILLYWDDVSQASIDRMLANGLDPECHLDRIKNEREYLMEYADLFETEVRKASKTVRIFHNSGHIYKNERERYIPFTHLELESLPTGGWGYDHFPISARYANTLGMQYLGMTGKFHTSWGEFGGYKQPVALEYECAAMIAMGARCSIGDQLHPCGKIDADTYSLISPAYRRVEKIEPYAIGATPVSEVALYSSEGHTSRKGRNKDDVHDAGACRILLESQIMFDVIDEESDFNAYRVIILPDVIQFETGPLLDKFRAYLAAGGKLVLSGRSGMNQEADAFALPFEAEVLGVNEFTPDYILVNEEIDDRLPRAPFVMYAGSMSVRSESLDTFAISCPPYFNRSWQKFCSHRHTPYVTEQLNKEGAIFYSENILYFSHNVFQEYHAYGQPLVKYLFVAALNRFLGKSLNLNVTMPSAGRVSHMRQDGLKRDIVHLLYAQPQKRGDAVETFHGPQPIEIIEDIQPLHGTELSLRKSTSPSRVYSAYDGKDIPFKFTNKSFQIQIPVFYIHEAIVIED